MPAPVDSASLPASDLVITREFQAPRTLVWQAWTDPAHLVKWWGPHRFRTPRATIDLRPGGALQIDMQAPDGSIMAAFGTVHEVVPPERLVISTRLEHDGERFVEVRHTITLEEVGARTRLTMHASVVFATAAAAGPLSGMREGWAQSLDRLASYVNTTAADREMVVTRRFHAPPARVWDAWTSPVHLERWWGPTGFTTTTSRFRFEPGGEWAHVMHGPDGTDYPNVLTYREIVAGERIAYVQRGGRLDGEPMDLEGTILFEPDDTGTRVTLRMAFASAAVRRRVNDEFGAYEGAHETLDRLADHLGVG